MENALGKSLMRVGGQVVLVLLMIAAVAGAQGRFNAEAVRLNNRGVAQMGQQFTEKAADSFAEAFKKDPKLAQAAVNHGIALMTLQKLDDAKKALKDAIALDPKSAQGWYNLGLAQHANNELDAALASFQQAIKIDSRDADSYYFEGVCYRELKQFDKAVEVLKQALAINPLHASSEFALARALQAMGKKDEAKEHFKLFQHMTSTKISAAIGLAYGEQGHYSTVTPVEEPQVRQRGMIPVKLVAREMVAEDRNLATRKSGLPPMPNHPTNKDLFVGTPGSRGMDGAPTGSGAPNSTETGGACMLDVTDSGQMDLVLMEQGAQAIRVLHRRGDGSFEEIDAAAAGLKVAGHGVACAVGDFDGDNLNDLAVALNDGVRLFRNLGKGKFQDVTTEAGLAARNRPSGITFVDYDHDGDLDLLLTGEGVKLGDAPNHPNDKDPSLGAPALVFRRLRRSKMG